MTNRKIDVTTDNVQAVHTHITFKTGTTPGAQLLRAAFGGDGDEISHTFTVETEGKVTLYATRADLGHIDLYNAAPEVYDNTTLIKGIRNFVVHTPKEIRDLPQMQKILALEDYEPDERENAVIWELVCDCCERACQGRSS